jgi:hypothetical protein
MRFADSTRTFHDSFAVLDLAPEYPAHQLSYGLLPTCQKSRMMKPRTLSRWIRIGQHPS